MKCFATTNSVMISPMGEIKPCCKYTGDFGHIDDYDGIDQILASEHYTRLRIAHAAGDFTSGCKKCKQSEDRGYSSRRTKYDKIYTDTDFLFDISPGLYCNLKCRMCNPYSSTGWFADWDALVKQGVVDAKPSKSINVYNMPDTDVDKIIDFLDNNQYDVEIEFKGGEPLMNPATRKLFQRMAATKHSDKISVNLITNGTYKADWLIDIACKFKKFDIGVSADGVGDVYEYIRGDRKHTWQRFMEVFESYKLIPNVNLSFNYVIQNTNVHQIAEFADCVAPYTVWWIQLNNPAHLATTVIPLSAREQLVAKITPMLEHMDSSAPQHAVITTLVAELSSGEQMDNKLYHDFIEYSVALDRLRNQNLLQVAPHLITDKGKLLYDRL